MRARLTLLLTLLVSLLVAVPTVGASPGDRYTGPYFGDGNLPPGCITDMSDSDCYHMRTSLNALDAPKIDVLVVVPVSPFAERDARIQVQAIEMWGAGIDYLAREMGLDWLADGVEFRIAVNHVDLLTGQGTEDFSTYPLWDPEIIVISSNPGGVIGIGVDPHDFSFMIINEIFGTDLPRDTPCHGVQNPFDLSQWEALSDFDDHHGQNTGTLYREDCDGAGGNVCFAVNAANDPDPGNDTGLGIDIFGLFNLVAHEVGHCLTLGHVGDAGDHTSKTVPVYDIMAYADDPVGRTKCVSTLDVEVFATRMSNYLDVNGDGVIDEDDLLLVNDQVGDQVEGQPAGNPFHVQHPRDHWYASSTGSPYDCPQPDLGIVPGERTNWTPEPDRATPELTITSPEDGATTDSTITVAGTVERVYDNASTTEESGAAPADSQGSPGALGSLGSLFSTPTVETTTWDGTFYPEQSTLGQHTATNDVHTLEVDGPATVEFELTWTDDLAPNDLDIFVTGAGTGSGTTGTPGEYVLLEDVDGTLTIRVDPWLVLDPLGTNYTLTATVTGGDDGGDDDDDDGGSSQLPATEAVLLYADDVLVDSQDVWTRQEADQFAITATLEPGTHVLRIDWEDRGNVIASETLTITVGEDGDDKHPSCTPHPKKGTTPPGRPPHCT